MSARRYGRQCDPLAPHMGRANRAAEILAAIDARRYAEQRAREAAAIDIQQTVLHRGWRAAIDAQVPERVRRLGVARGTNQTITREARR